LRAEGLLADLPPGVAKARLSGMLIGLDLAATRPYWLGQSIAVLGDTRLAGLYVRALTLQGIVPRRIAGRAATLAGLARTRGTGA
jgi:2-dehydro-3-deoxygalactonokinase